MQPVLLAGWIILTLVLSTLVLILAKRYGLGIAVGVFAGMVVVANVIAVKPVIFGPFVVPAAVLIYAATFLMTDVITEIWGKREAQLAIIGGFLANIFLVLGVYLTIKWPGARFWQAQQALESILGLTPRIVFASMVAYLISQTHDVLAFHFWKRKTRGRHLWLRNNLSTAVSQLIDTGIFITIAFYGILPLVPLIIGQYLIKLIIALCDTPFCYLGVKILVGKKIQIKNACGR